MGFEIDTTFAETLDAIREFVIKRIEPVEKAFLTQSFEAGRPTLDALRQEVKERGWWAPQLPKSLGGMGLSLRAHARMGEVLGWSPLGHYVFGTQAPDAGNIEVLHQFGNDAQKQRWLEPLAAGEVRSCFGMTEPEHAGSNPVNMSTTAIEDGEHWVINGHKWFTTAADGAAVCILMVVTDPDAESPYARASMILVPTDTPGFEHVRNIPIMGEEGDGWASHGEIRLTDVRVPRDHLIGERGQGFLIAQERLGPGRIHHCMRWIGIAERSLDLMCRRVVGRELSPGKTIGSRQFVQGWIAESRAEIDAARLMVLDAAEKMDRLGTHGARVEISCIKFFVAGVLQRVVDRAIQAHGALGITDDTVLSWFYRHERGARIYDGPDEVHKLVVARRVLKQYGVDGGRVS